MITPQCGGDSEKDTPVTMPNTEVKLLSADCSEGLPLVRVGRRHAVSNETHKVRSLCVHSFEKTNR